MRKLGIGYQDFEQLRKNNNFYVDKTKFICDWWANGDAVTLITRPRSIFLSKVYKPQRFI